MSAEIVYRLSQAGCKASLLAGGDGKTEQHIQVGRDDPLFPRVVQRGVVSGGKVFLTIYFHQFEADAPLTAAEVLDRLDAIDAAANRKREEEKQSTRQATLDVLRTRRTIRSSRSVSVDREGNRAQYGPASADYSFAAPHWPHDPPEEVTKCEEAQAWEAELQAANAAAEEAAFEAAKVKWAAWAEEERQDKERADARKAELDAMKLALGGQPTDYLVRVKEGAACNVPCWEGHKRGKNWCAKVAPSPSGPGGLNRTFWKSARGEWYYVVPDDLQVGDALEFGADYYSGGGRKNAKRFYGFVVASQPDALLLRPAASGKEACEAGKEWAQTHGPAPVEDAVEKGIARINGEGAITTPE